MERFNLPAHIDPDKFNKGIELLIQASDYEGRLKETLSLLNGDETNIRPDQVVWFKTVGRRSGNTTRLIDAAIQIIFHGKLCVVRGSSGQDSFDSDKYLFDKILDRIKLEHPGSNVEYNKSNLTIWLDKMHVPNFVETYNQKIWQRSTK